MPKKYPVFLTVLNLHSNVGLGGGGAQGVDSRMQALTCSKKVKQYCRVWPPKDKVSSSKTVSSQGAINYVGQKTPGAVCVEEKIRGHSAD